MTQGAGFFLGSVDPSRNRLASTTYFAIESSVICIFMHSVFCIYFIQFSIFMETRTTVGQRGRSWLGYLGVPKLVGPQNQGGWGVQIIHSIEFLDSMRIDRYEIRVCQH